MEVFYIFNNTYTTNKLIFPSAVRLGSVEDMYSNGFNPDEICGDNTGHIIKYYSSYLYLYVKKNGETIGVACLDANNKDILFLQGICSKSGTKSGTKLIHWIKVIAVLNHYDSINLSSYTQSIGFYTKNNFTDMQGRSAGTSYITDYDTTKYMTFNIPQSYLQNTKTPLGSTEGVPTEGRRRALSLRTHTTSSKKSRSKKLGGKGIKRKQTKVPRYHK